MFGNIGNKSKLIEKAKKIRFLILLLFLKNTWTIFKTFGHFFKHLNIIFKKLEQF